MSPGCLYGSELQGGLIAASILDDQLQRVVVGHEGFVRLFFGFRGRNVADGNIASFLKRFFAFILSQFHSNLIGRKETRKAEKEVNGINGNNERRNGRRCKISYA